MQRFGHVQVEDIPNGYEAIFPRSDGVLFALRQALAGELDPQGIYVLVGEELRQIFDAQTVTILTYDHQNDLFIYRYIIEKGSRLSVAPRQPAGFSGHILVTRQPLLITRAVDQRAARCEHLAHCHERAKRVLPRFGDIAPHIDRAIFDDDRVDFVRLDRDLPISLAPNHFNRGAWSWSSSTSTAGRCISSIRFSDCSISLASFELSREFTELVEPVKVSLAAGEDVQWIALPEPKPPEKPEKKESAESPKPPWQRLHRVVVGAQRGTQFIPAQRHRHRRP